MPLESTGPPETPLSAPAHGKKVSVILNSGSGFGNPHEAAHQVDRTLSAGGVWTEVIPVKPGMDLAQLARQRVAQGADIVVAGGGDGTVRAVAQGVTGTDAAMAILPAGTWNHLARDLEMPLELTEALEALRQGKVVRVDVGEVNGAVFVNNSILGLYPIYRRYRDIEQRKGRWPWLALVIGWAKVLARNPHMTLRMEMGDRVVTRRTQYVLVANNEHRLKGYELGNRERLNEGRLWVHVLRPRGRMGLLGLFVKLLLGRLDREREFEVFAADRVTLHSEAQKLPVAVDGEMRMLDTPLRYRSRAQELRIVVPAQAAERLEGS